MAMTANLYLEYKQAGVDEYGNPLFNVTLPDDDQEPHLLYTGKHSDGVIELPDGTSYHVGASVIRVLSHEHAKQLNHLIGVQHENARRLGYGASLERTGSGEQIVAPHVCNENCGELARPTTASDAYRQQQGLLASGAAEAAASNAVAALITYTNLHSASTGTTGANELGSTRQATAWTTGTSGSPNPSNTSGLSYSLAASTTATHIGGWGAVTTGTFYVGFPLSPSVTTGTSAGTVTVAIGALVIGTT